MTRYHHRMLSSAYGTPQARAEVCPGMTGETRSSDRSAFFMTVSSRFTMSRRQIWPSEAPFFGSLPRQARR